MDAHYVDFAAALAGTTATLVGLLIGLAAAFYVFARDRAAQLEDDSERAKLEIVTIANRLIGDGPRPFMLFPPQLVSDYRSHYQEKADSDFVFELMTDFLFERTAVVEAIDSLPTTGVYAGPWRGRFFYWILAEAIRALTVGASEGYSKVGDVFPNEPGGPGFDEWRRTFERVSEALRFLRGWRDPMHSDFGEWIATLEQSGWAQRQPDYWLEIAESLFRAVDSVNQHLLTIDRLRLLRRRYDLNGRFHSRLIVGTIATAAVAGILAPLIYLAVPALRMPAFVPPLTLGVVVLTCAVAFGEVIRGAVMTTSVPRDEFVRRRWLQPILAELDRQNGGLDSGASVDLELFARAANSPEASGFPSAVSTELREFLDRAITYNAAVTTINEQVLTRVRSSADLAYVMNNPPNEGGLTLRPAVFAQTRRFSLWIDSYARAPQPIMIETSFGWWGRTEAKIRRPIEANEVHTIANALKDVQVEIEQSEACQRYRLARAAVGSAADHLRETLTMSRHAKENRRSA